jgi:hypothetical protein
VTSFAKGFEPQVEEAAHVDGLIGALDIGENDAATFQDAFEEEEWWKTYRKPPLLSALVTDSKVLAIIGPEGLRLVDAEVVARARERGVASGVIDSDKTAYAVAAARVTGFKRRAGDDHPTVILGTPLVEAARFALARGAAETIGLAQGGRLLEAVGEGEPRAALAGLVGMPLLEGHGVLLRDGWAGTRTSLGRDLALLSVFRAPPAPPLKQAALPLAVLGAGLLLVGIAALFRRRLRS